MKDVLKITSFLHSRKYYYLLSFNTSENFFESSASKWHPLLPINVYLYFLKERIGVVVRLALRA